MDLATFTEDILNGKLHFLYILISVRNPNKCPNTIRLPMESEKHSMLLPAIWNIIFLSENLAFRALFIYICHVSMLETFSQSFLGFTKSSCCISLFSYTNLLIYSHFPTSLPFLDFLLKKVLTKKIIIIKTQKDKHFISNFCFCFFVIYSHKSIS